MPRLRHLGTTVKHRAAQIPVDRAALPDARGLVRLQVSRLIRNGILAPTGPGPVVHHDRTVLGIDLAGGIAGLRKAMGQGMDRVPLAADLLAGRP